MRVIIIIIVLVVLVAAGFLYFNKGGEVDEQEPSPTQEDQEELMEKISFVTSDGVTIVGNYWKGSGSEAVLLLHMMPAVKESWNGFAEKLNAVEYHVLAIDLRGHGESTRSSGGELNYEKFSDKEHQASINDVVGAVDWFVEQGISRSRISIGGASIGANLAIQYLSENPDIPTGIALSPGLDFRGVETEGPMSQLGEEQRVFLVAADDDDYSAESVRTLGQAQTGREIKTEVFPSGGHGTNMFEEHPELMDEFLGWLDSR